MKKIDFGKVLLKSLDGKELGVDQQEKRQTIANAVLESKGSPVKLYSLATKIFNGAIEVDEDDWKIILEAVKNSTGITTLGKAQFILAMEAVK